mmetsp:Transcript_71133/g.197604  ORF Transcript_71133/g.197604 Transcript_71133/m.197604 type:complete len:161 (+) Transcript_71133:111-593(+)
MLAFLIALSSTATAAAFVPVEAPVAKAPRAPQPNTRFVLPDTRHEEVRSKLRQPAAAQNDDLRGILRGALAVLAAVAISLTSAGAAEARGGFGRLAKAARAAAATSHSSVPTLAAGGAKVMTVVKPRHGLLLAGHDPKDSSHQNQGANGQSSGAADDGTP